MKALTKLWVPMAAVVCSALVGFPYSGFSQTEKHALPDAKVGQLYEFAIMTEGGMPPLTWKLQSGEFPPGIELLPSGVLKGNPTAVRKEPYEFVLEVSDSSTPPQTATQRFSLVVRAAQLRFVSGPKEPVASNVKANEKPSMPSETGENKSSGGDSKEASVSPAKGQASAEGRAEDETGKSPDAEITGLPLRQWDYVLSGKMQPHPDAKEVKIKVLVGGKEVTQAHTEVAAESNFVDKKKGRFRIWLNHSLVEKETVLVIPVFDGTPGTPSKEVTVLGPASADGECSQSILDCRHTFEGTAYLGIAIDTFASGEARRYLNPNAPSGPLERLVGGFDFDYRLTGRPKHAASQNAWFPNQLWVYGETVHGARSTDIDCQKNMTFLTCQNAGINLPNRPFDQILYTLRNATSLEAFMGFRYEFLSLQRWSHAPANIYLKTQAGFLTVSGSADDVKDVHHVGLGAIATRGKFRGSYLEAGFGRTDLFAEKSKDRWKVDGYLTWPWPGPAGKYVNFFVQMTADTDLGSGADSVQTYFGFEFDLRKFARWLTPGNSNGTASSNNSK